MSFSAESIDKIKGVFGLRIGMSFDDTLTDTNYTAIEFINRRRVRENWIDSRVFDRSKKHSIWLYKGLTLEERLLRYGNVTEMLNEIELCPLAGRSIVDSIARGNELYIFSDRPEKDKSKVYAYLLRKGIHIPKENLVMGLDSESKRESAERLELDFYVDDQPSVLKTFYSSKVGIVVRDQPYNRNFQTLVRLECFSQLKAIEERFSKSKEQMLGVKELVL